MMLFVDERFPTHEPAVQCEVCGGDDELVYRDRKFLCRGTHTYHHKAPIPAPDKFQNVVAKEERF